MKRLFPVILTLMLILTLAIAGCGGGNSGGGNPGGDNPGGDNQGGDNPGGDPPTSGITLAMLPVSGGLTFPTDNDSVTTLADGESIDETHFITIHNAYFIAQTDVTYGQWSTVYTWATTIAANRYTFAHAGVGGSSGSSDPLQPVTTISWQDAIVWCNALTEYYNANNGTHYECVYTNNGAIVRNSNDDYCTNVTAVSTAKGFRLPTNNEWELAARYIGTTVNAPAGSAILTEAIPSGGIYWTPGTYASGATGTNSNATVAVAVCINNGIPPTAPVGSKAANGLGLYDMSGNVWQMCFECFPGQSERLIRGGGYNTPCSNIYISCVSQCDQTEFDNSMGFRPVMTQ